MSLEVAGISLRVDSTDAVTAKQNLDAMAKAGASSAAAFGQVETGARSAGAALAGTATAAAAGARGIASTANGAKGAADGLRATGQQAKLTANQTAQLSAQLQDLFVQVQSGGSPLTALIQRGSQLSAVFGGVARALRAVGTVLLSTATAALSSTAAAASASTKGIASAAGRAKTATDGLKATGQAAALTGHQTAQLSAQLQDLFVQIQAGGSPMTALIQQGSQLSAVFGGVAPALRAVGTVLLTTATAYAALAAAGIGLGAAFVIGREQSADLARAIILSGNAAGVTEGQFNALAQSIATSTNTTIGSTRDALQGLASSGRISAEALGVATTAAQLLSKATGQSSTEIAQQFAKAADAPAKFAEELNKQYNFLNATQLAYIRGLEDQGRGQEALTLTFTQLIPRLQQAAGATSELGKAFQEAKNQVSAFFDSLVSGLGRTDTAEQQLERVRAQIAELQRAGQTRYVFGPSLSDLQQQQAGLERTIAGQREVAAIAGQRVQREQALDRVNKALEQSLDRQKQKTKALADANALADAASLGRDDPRRLELLAGVNRRFNTGGGGQQRAELAADLAAIRATEAEKLTIYRNTEGVIDALRSAGVLREADYYDAKRAYARLDQQAQEEAINAEIARLQAFKGSAAENLDAQKQITQARGQLAQVQAAGAAKAAILDIQQKSAVDALARSFRELEFAAVEAYQATVRRVEFVTGAQSMGDRARDQAADEFNVRERYTRQIQQLEAQNRAGAFAADQAQFARRRQLLLDNQEFELAQTAEAYRLLEEGRKKWENGVSVGIANVLDGASSTAEQTRALTEDAFRGLGDALTDVFTTGKADWSSLEKTIVSGITRIIVEQQLIRPLAQFLGGGPGGEGVLTSLFSSVIGGIFGGGGSGMPDDVPTRGGRAMGGRVEAGGLYPVNELASHGPGEILSSGGRQYLMARQDGYVQPMAGGAGGMAQTNHFHITGPVDRRTQQQIATAAGRGAQQAMARNG